MDATTSDIKIELIQWLSTLEDKSIIEKILNLRKEETDDWWMNMSAAENNSIEKGIEDAENNNVTSHSEARKLYERWL